MVNFCNLHVHSYYSHDAISKIKDIVKATVKNGQHGVAITDHGNMSGAVAFYKECKDNGLKAVIGCLLAGQEILTENGIKKIENIQTGDMVYTHTGSLEKVLGTMKRSYNGNLYTIELANSKNRSLNVTGEHPILISDNKGNKKWIPVSEIEYGRIQNYSTKNISGTNNHKAYVCCPKIYGDTTNFNPINYIGELFTYNNKNIYKKYKSSKYDSLGEWNNFNNNIELDKEFCYFWGLFLAEGSIATKENVYNTTGQCCMTFHWEEDSYINFCKTFLEKRFNIIAKIYPRKEKRIKELVWCNLPFAHLLGKLCGFGSHNKFINNLAFKMPLKNQEFLLQGLVDGDCKHLSIKNKQKQQTLRTASENLAWSFRQLLLNFGHFSRVAKSKDGLYNVPYLKYRKYARSLEDDKYVYYPIINIKISNIETFVYNIHVEKDNSYLSDFALHNCEFYICENQKSATLKDGTNKSLNHLVVLAKNTTGYKNMLKLTQLANQHFYYKPRIDEEMLFAHSEGLIVINGHIGTSIADILFFNLDGVKDCETLDCARQYLYPDYKEQFLAIASRYKKVFGDDFYIECQFFDKGDIVQQSIGNILYELSQEFGFKAVGTGDCHYVNNSEEDAMLHRTFNAIAKNTKIEEFKDIRYFYSGMYGLVTNELAQECYHQDLIDATIEILNKVEDYDIIKKQSIPNYPVDNKNEFLRQICQKQIGVKCPNTKEYIDRFEYELKIIKDADLAGYYLIVQDFINWAEDNNILCGAGRGSACGSLISYLCGITKVDPIPYGLLFERFYNLDRIGQLPDIDTDFPATKRESVIEYIKSKYGNDRVAHVATYGTLQGKGAIKDVLRVYNVCNHSVINKITKQIPGKERISDKLVDFKEKHGTDSILLYTLIEEPEALKDYVTINEDGEMIGDFAHYFKIASKLEGCIKTVSRHASAIIISDKPIVESAALIKDKNSDNLMCAYDMHSFELAGLVKFDILGLKNLDCLMEVNSLIAKIGVQI